MKDCSKCIGCNTGNEIGAGGAYFVQAQRRLFEITYKKGAPEPDCPGYLLKYEFLDGRSKAILDAARIRAGTLVEKPAYCVWLNKFRKNSCDVCRQGCSARSRCLQAVLLEDGSFRLPTIGSSLCEMMIDKNTKEIYVEVRYGTGKTVKAYYDRDKGCYNAQEK
jgi:hypothetical protein